MKATKGDFDQVWPKLVNIFNFVLVNEGSRNLERCLLLGGLEPERTNPRNTSLNKESLQNAFQM